MAKLTVKPLHATIGAEVTGIDFRQPVDHATRDALSKILAEHLALVFPGQSLTPAQYLQAAGAFGPPMRQHYSQYNMADFPNIGVIHHRDGQAPAEGWHTDHTNRERPPAATILYAVEVPSSGGETSVANMRAAYQALPEDQRRRLETLQTVNGLDRDRRDVRDEDMQKYGRPIVHPMVRTHPVHGSNAVYFHPTKTLHIEGMTPQDSKSFIDNLLGSIVQPGIVYTHAWRQGDMFVIDDRATLHRAHGDYDRSQSRILWRIIVEGDRPRLLAR